MATHLRIILIDEDPLRRARIVHGSTRDGIHVEPFESSIDLPAMLPLGCVVLVHDHGDAVTKALNHFENDWHHTIAYAPDPAPGRVVDAVLAGALDYLTWPFTHEDIAASVAKVFERGASVAATRARARHALKSLEKLSPRELQVVNSMTDGLTNKAIAARLQISPRTVEIHRSNAMRKLGVSNSRDAARLAFQARSLSN